MTIKECYQAFGGNYENVFSRFRSEERIQKYLYKFIDDYSFRLMQEALENGRIEDAFHSAHTLKGVSENLGFDTLVNSAHEITEALRNGDEELAFRLLPQVCKDYQITIAAIIAYQNEDCKDREDIH